MYSWGDSMEDWARPGAYRFDSARKAERAKDAREAASRGPRTYNHRGPDESLIDPKKHLAPKTKTPLVIAVDVTGSMAGWPAEIFDRLPLVYNTLSQYRPDLEICFAAIGDAHCDRWPLQVTRFAKGFALETELKSLYGEGGGGDEPESYGLFAWWLANHVSIKKTGEKPFLIVFGDATMHAKIKASELTDILGARESQNQDSIKTWQQVARTWDTWFLRRAGRKGDKVDKQWSQAVGEQKIIQIHDEPRAVDYAMGLIARHWGHFGDFKVNMSARQEEAAIAKIERRITRVMRDTGRTA
ncbi:MAG: hypothetical protein AB7S38_33705 [Vulcanimicrobiota bacterium]